MQKGRKAQEQPFKDILGTRHSINFRRKRRKLANLGKNLGSFHEKCILMSSSVVKLQASLQQRKKVFYGKLISISPKNEF